MPVVNPWKPIWVVCLFTNLTTAILIALRQYHLHVNTRAQCFLIPIYVTKIHSPAPYPPFLVTIASIPIVIPVRATNPHLNTQTKYITAIGLIINPPILATIVDQDSLVLTLLAQHIGVIRNLDISPGVVITLFTPNPAIYLWP